MAHQWHCAGLLPGEALSAARLFSDSCMAPKVFVVMLGTDALLQVAVSIPWSLQHPYSSH